MTLVPVRGAEIHYAARGRGPVCLVPSLIGTRPYEILMPAPLAEQLRLVCVDLRGGGRSTGVAADLTLDVLAADLEAVRADLGVEQVAVLGHSILGVLAIEYARRCPASVSHVIAVGTPPSGDMLRLAQSSAEFFEAQASDGRKQVLRENLSRLPPDPSPGQALQAQTPLRFYDPRFDATALYAEAILRPELLRHVMGPLTQAWQALDGAGEGDAPLLIAHGRHDYSVPHVLWDGLVARLPRATLRLFEHSGHQPFFEEPDVFCHVVTDWMTAAPRSPRADRRRSVPRCDVARPEKMRTPDLLVRSRPGPRRK